MADLLRGCIASGSIVLGAELPKEAEIAERLGVSLITVRQALRDLASDGLIRKRSAKPAIVVSRTPTLSRGWNFENFADVAAFTQGRRSFRSDPIGKESAPELRRHFGLDRGEAGYCLRSILAVGAKKSGADHHLFSARQVGARFRKADLPTS